MTENEIRALSESEFWDILRVLEKEAYEADFFEAINIYCADKVKLFAHIYFPHFCTKPWNEFHEEFFKTTKYRERRVRRAWASPRGSAKSTIVSLIKPLHDHVYALEHFILLISNTDDQATQKVKDIRNEVLSNSLLRTGTGIYFDKKKPPETEFIIHGPDHQTFVMAAGAGKQIRGIRFGPRRPTKIILDDVEHSERVFSERQRDKLASYIREDVGKVGDEETNIEIVGTVLHRKSYLSELLKNPAYESKKYRSIKSWPERRDLWDEWENIYMALGNPNRIEDAQAFYVEHQEQMLKGFEVMWPEKESPLYLMQEMLEIGRRAFMKEKQNEPLGDEEKVFDVIKYYHEHTLEDGTRGIVIEHEDQFISLNQLNENFYGALDPATGQTKSSKSKKGDFACLVTGALDPMGRLLVHWDYTKRHSPTKQIEAIFDAHEQFGFQKFGVETNLYRNLLLPNIIEERKRREKATRRAIKIPFYDIENTEQKDRRIHRLEPKVSHGWILFNRTLSHEFMGQVEDYPHADHDDCPDALDMLWGLVHGRYRASEVSLNPLGGH